MVLQSGWGLEFAIEGVYQKRCSSLGPHINRQEGQVDKVLNGDINPFIKTYLMQKPSGTLDRPSADAEDD